MVKSLHNILFPNHIRNWHKTKTTIKTRKTYLYRLFIFFSINVLSAHLNILIVSQIRDFCFKYCTEFCYACLIHSSFLCHYFINQCCVCAKFLLISFLDQCSGLQSVLLSLLMLLRLWSAATRSVVLNCTALYSTGALY